MWYESKMINETLDSLEEALKYSTLPVEIKICLNSQTYIEKPIKGEPEDMFKEFMDHPIMQKALITKKTDSDPFYNIGDWRRDIYSNKVKYTVWGESDCLLPTDFFYILSNLNIEGPHILSPANRKMGDPTWSETEGEGLDQYGWSWPDRIPSIPFGYFCNDYINQSQLNQINNFKENISIIKISQPKIAGALLCLSPDLPKFIPEDMHFAREDYCADLVFRKKGIPHYIIKNRFVGHNFQHPLKRTNTLDSREDNLYKKYEAESWEAAVRFIKNYYK